MKDRKIIVCGGDTRLLYTARMIAEENIKCAVWNGAPGDIGSAYRCTNLKAEAEDADSVILPIPAFSSSGRLICKNADRCNPDVESVFRHLKSGTKVFGGKFSDISKRISSEYNLRLYDYGVREEFSLLNAVPTAEAAIFEAMKLLKKTVFDAEFAVIGYGRVGKALATRLLALGADVTVAARSAVSLSAAECDGMRCEKLSDFLSHPTSADICFNTVPVPIINDEFAAISPSVLFIDLASVPGGFTEEARTLLGDRLTPALSLPGKYSPETAGKIIYKTVCTICAEIDE